MKSWRPAPEPLILYSIRHYNILPLTSRCNVHCVFCSHGQNPKNVYTYYVENSNLERVKQWAQYLDGRKKIVIGESATKICEGEPLAHPQIKEILRFLRQSFPETLLQLTTNGILLDEAMVEFLVELAPVELYLSINSITGEGRKQLMADGKTSGLDLLKRLQKASLPYHGSLVAMPWLVGWEDVVQTVEALDAHGAKTIRIFLPGFTKYAPARLRFSPQLWEELSLAVADLKQKIATPITLEPPYLKDLQGQVGGVMEDSPAALAGLKAGDIIETIEGQKVFSRVEAFYQLLEAQDPFLEIRRNGEKIKVVVKKAKGEASGVVMDYDLSFREIEDVLREIRRHKASCPLILASTAGYSLLKEGLEKLAPSVGWEILAVPNQFFGGSIIAAGLLVVEDFLQVWHRLDDNLKKSCDLLLLPAKAFDPQGKDLTGRSYFEVAQKTGKEVTLV